LHTLLEINKANKKGKWRGDRKGHEMTRHDYSKLKKVFHRIVNESESKKKAWNIHKMTCSNK
jgi:hypothetical protein